MLRYLTALLLVSCSAFQVPTTIPVMDKYNAVELALYEVVDWAREHEGETKTIQETSTALDEHDYTTALDDCKKLLVESAAHGDAPPREIIAALTLVENMLAAEAIQDGMRSISK